MVIIGLFSAIIPVHSLASDVIALLSGLYIYAVSLILVMNKAITSLFYIPIQL